MPHVEMPQMQPPGEDAIRAFFSGLGALLAFLVAFSRRHPRWAAVVATTVLTGAYSGATGTDPRMFLKWLNEPTMRPLLEDMQTVKEVVIRVPGGDSVFRLIQSERRQRQDSINRYEDSMKGAAWRGQTSTPTTTTHTPLFD